MKRGKNTDKFQSDKKNAVCKSLLRSFTKTSETTDDPVMIHTMPVGRESPNTHASALSIEHAAMSQPRPGFSLLSYPGILL